MTLKSETRNRLLLVLASLAFGVVVLESLASLEIIDYRALLSRVWRHSDQFASTNVFDRGLHLHPPHAHFTGSAWGGEVTGGYQIRRSDMTLYRWDARYDKNGFRNESDLTSAEITVIGDSFIEALTTPTSELLTSRLSQIGGKVVANLGQYGYGPLEELEVLKRYALPLHPGTVVWMFSEASDIQDTITYRNYLRSLNKPPEPPKPMPERSFPRKVLDHIRNRLPLTLIRFALRPSGTKRAGVVKLADGRDKTIYFNYQTLGPYNEKELRALDEIDATLATAEKLSSAQGIRFLFVFIPMKFRVYHQYCRFPAQSECRNWFLNDTPGRLRKAVGPLQPGIGYLDLTPLLTDAVKRGLSPYYYDDDHWSSAGQEIAAQAINQYLSTMPAR